MIRRLTCLLVASAVVLPVAIVAQSFPIYQGDFSAQELAARRARVMEAIGPNAIAIVQGAPDVSADVVFRQSNEMYYLTGIETAHAYLLLDGRTKKSALYLPHRDEPRERNEGKMLSAEDAEEVKKLTGVDTVDGLEAMARSWQWTLTRKVDPVLYTPFSPAETGTDARDTALGAMASYTADPWDGRASREGHFIQLMHERFPQYEIRNLSPILDKLRLIKSPREIELIRRASQIAALGLMEAMRSTKPGVMEYQLEAVARYEFQVNGARREAYSSITAGGTNAWMGHYFHAKAAVQSGDMVLMDYAPDYRYYTSDVTRMWPVNGKYTADQRALCNFILAYRNALLKRIKPGAVPNKILDEASAEMSQYLKTITFSKPEYRKGAEGALTFRGHLSHPVGMSVHDVGTYTDEPLRAGLVFSIDPMLWIPEEKLYVRMEDVVTVTDTGVENFTDFMLSTPDEIEAVMKGEGLLQKAPPTPARGK